MITKAKRKQMEDLIYSVFDALDEDEVNSGKYKELFDEMSDTQFDSFFKKLFANEDAYLTLDIVDYDRPLKIENIEKAAKLLNVPLFEKVVMPFANMNLTTPTVTKYEVPVGYVHLKRMQQMLFKKNSMSTDITIRSSTSGQVTGDDKNSRSTDIENYALVSLDVHDGMKEFLGPRADDMVSKTEMYAAISQKGYVSLNDLTDNVDNKVALNTLDVYFIGCGLKTDLITKGLKLRKTLNDRKK